MQPPGPSQTQKDLEAREQKQLAVKRQQELELEQKAIKSLKSRQFGFTSSTPTSLNQSTNQTD